MANSDMTKLLDEREMKAMEIAELQSEKVAVEREVMAKLLDDRNYDCFSINWNRVRTCYR